MARAGIESTSLDLHCKRTLYRTSSSFASIGDTDDRVMLYMDSIGGMSRNSMVSRNVNPDGTISIEIYSTGE